MMLCNADTTTAALSEGMQNVGAKVAMVAGL